jgi:hypothetical protein
MAETTADVRRDIEQTRERMSTTLTELEQRLNVMQVVRDHPWPVLAVAFGAGLALSASGSDAKAAVATMAATKGSRTKIGSALDEIVANLMTGVHGALQERIDGWVDELKGAIGAPSGNARNTTRRPGMVATTGGYGTGPTTSDLASTQPGRAD